jgi:hypothetical protein
MRRRAVRTPVDMGALPPVVACALFWMLFAMACAPSRSAPTAGPAPTTVGAPIPVPEKPVPIDPLAEPWLVGVPRATITHQIEVTTAVRAAATVNALPAAPVDSLRTTLSIRWDSGGAARRRAGLVTSYALGAILPRGVPAMTTPAELALPIAVTAEVDVGRQMVRIISPLASSCTADAAVAQAVREVLLAPPERLRRGLSWTDSLRTTVCRDAIPLMLTSARLYVVEDARVQDGRAVVVIRRRSTTTWSGTGTQFGEPVTIAGEGQGELLFGLRLDDGQITDGNGVSSLTLTLTGLRKTQVVTQSARLEIRRAF